MLAVFRGIGRLVRVARADHNTLYSGDHTKASAGRRHFYVTVACAPSRRFWRPRRVSPTGCLVFLNGVVPNGFEAPPTESRREVVAYVVSDEDDDPTHWSPVRSARVAANGLVELLTRVRSTDDGPRVDLLEAVVPVYRLAVAVRDGAYARAYGLPTRLRRLDWFVFLGNFTSDERGSRHWKDLDFPGRRPRGRGTDAYPTASNQGLAWRELRSRAQRTEPALIVRLVLADLLTESGWDGNEQAVEDTIGAVENFISTDPSIESTH